MTAPLMTVGEFQDILDRFGENPADWPSDRRSSAESLLARSDAARNILAEAKALRQRFNDSGVTAPPGLADRIVAKALDKGGKP